MSDEPSQSPSQAAGQPTPDLTAALQHAKASLARLQPKLPANFRFQWREVDCLARIDGAGQDLRLRLACDLGPLPFSAENARLRGRLSALVRWSQGADECRFAITRRQRLTLLVEHALSEPFSREDALAYAIQILIRARPYLDIVFEQRQTAVA